MIESALNHGKNVLIEKPIARDYQEALKIQEIASKKKNQIIIVDHELRFLSSMQKMRALLQEGLCGKIFHVEGSIVNGSMVHTKNWNWWYESDKGGGILMAIGSHVIDSLQFLTGSKVASVNGSLVTCIKEREEGDSGIMKPVTADDFCTSLLQFDQGFTGTLTVSMVSMKNNVHKFTVSGSKGTLTIDKGVLTFFKPGQNGARDGTEEKILEDEMEKDPPLNSVWGVGSIQIASAIKEKLELKGNKIDSIGCSIEDSVFIQKVLDAIKTSNQQNGNGIRV